LTDDARLSKRTDKELIRIIEGSAPHGTVSSDMPQWNRALSYTQIRSLASYVRYMHRGKFKLTGDPVSGKAIYDGSCAQCHGDDGEGDGVLTRVYSMSPANHTNAKRMDAMNNEAMRAIIANGGPGKSLMPGWKGILSKQEIEDVMSYIRLMAAH
jgi:mono/diheme cytochrome c family protein